MLIKRLEDKVTDELLAESFGLGVIGLSINFLSNYLGDNQVILAAFYPSSSVTAVRTAISLLGRKTTHPSWVALTIDPIRAAATGKSI